MKKLLLTLILIGSVSFVKAADITLTYTPIQLKSVESAVLKMNEQKIATFLAETPEGDTNTVQLTTASSYMQELFNSKLDAIVRQQAQALAAEVAQKYIAAPTEAQTQVKTVLQVEE